MLYIDRYAYCSRLRDTNPLEKFIFAFTTMVICLWANSIVVSIVIITLMIGVAVLKGGIPLSFYLKLILIPFSFLMIGVLTIAINVIVESSKMLWGFQIFGYTLGFTVQSLELAAKVFFKALGAVTCLYFLSLTTPIADILSVLKKFKFPVLFLELMILIYRFIFMLIETADQMFLSQISRLGYYGLKNGLDSLGQMGSTLFIRSYKRSQDLYITLEARCYQGKLEVLEEVYPISKSNLLLIFLAESVLIMITFFSRR
ncbi:MAG TPA: cobalt ECF transporter T component CbiQ [Firmicutes bacterium]|jgi:cobalt/nickel transport system permease protein|nr:cobalt ECF transporter T component CbiQ [Bacillota bacterium]